VPAPLERGEVEEPEVHGLLDLVGKVAAEDDAGDVRLDQLRHAVLIPRSETGEQALDKAVMVFEREFSHGRA
jgi:uncharacterized membrane protein (DUF2068 family)